MNCLHHRLGFCFTILVVFVYLSALRETLAINDIYEDFMDGFLDSHISSNIQVNAFSTSDQQQLPFLEQQALYDFYTSTHGEHWFDPRKERSGVKWNFNETTGVPLSHPCFDNWMGLACTCINSNDNSTSSGEFYYFAYENYGGYYYQPESVEVGYGHSMDDVYDAQNITVCHISKIYLLHQNLTGTIPDSLSDLRYLTHLHLSANNLHGEFPREAFSFVNLAVLDLGENQFSGTLPEDIGLLSPALMMTNLMDNSFHGTIPESFGNLTNLVSVLLGGSRDINGPIPESFGQLLKLRFLFVTGTSLSGTIPKVIYKNCADLGVVYINANQFTGPTHLETLFAHNRNSIGIIDIGNNLFTGPLPANIYNNSDKLTRFSVINNHISGTIPLTFTGLPKLEVLILSQNPINHILPASLVQNTALKWLFIAETDITGSIPSSIGQLSNLLRLKLNSNYLTSTVPLSIAALRNIQEISLYSNLLSGSLPTDSTNTLLHLEVILMQNNQFTGRILRERVVSSTAAPTAATTSAPVITPTHTLAIKHIDFSNNRLTGTIPFQLFATSRHLSSFAVAKNCIHGTIPVAICSSQTLEKIILDGMNTGDNCDMNKVTSSRLFSLGQNSVSLSSENRVGTVPDCLFKMRNLNTLHISGNRITGTIPDVEQVSAALQDISLSHNELQGSIPHNLQLRSWTNLDLSYNKLTNTLIDNFHTLNQTSRVSLAVNRLSGQIPLAFRYALNVDILQGSLFGCDYEGSTLPRHDDSADNYGCGSNSLNLLLYVWLGLLVLFMVYERVDNFLQLKDTQATDNLSWVLLRKIQRMFIRVTAIIMLALLPAYLVLARMYKNYTYSYAWATSAIYLSGPVPSVVCVVLWTTFLLLLFLRCESVLFREEFRQQIANKRIVKQLQKLNLLAIHSSVSHIASLCLFSAFNVLVVVVVNIGYVYIDINYDATINALAQVALAFFKLLWNCFLLPHTLTFIYKKPEYDTALTRQHNKIVSNQAEMNSIVYETLLNLFNNIIAPCVAIFAVNVNCFYNLIVPPPEVGVSYTISECAELRQSFNAGCFLFNVNTYSTMFSPPYSYSYQCSSALVTGYASVFVYMYVLDTFINPVLLWLILKGMKVYRKFSDKLKKRESEKLNNKNSGGKSQQQSAANQKKEKRKSKSKVKGFLKFSSSGSSGGSGYSSGSGGHGKTGKSTRSLVFLKNRFVIKFITNAAILMTFGMIFPALALIICYSVLSEIRELQAGLSEYFCNSDSVGVSGVKYKNRNDSDITSGNSTNNNNNTNGNSNGEKQVVSSDSGNSNNNCVNSSDKSSFNQKQQQIREVEMTTFDIENQHSDTTGGGNPYATPTKINSTVAPAKIGLNDRPDLDTFQSVGTLASPDSARYSEGLSTRDNSVRRSIRSSFTGGGSNKNSSDYKLRQIETKFSKVSYIISHLLWMLFPLSALFYAFFLFDMLGDSNGFFYGFVLAVIMLGVPIIGMCVVEVIRNILTTREMRQQGQEGDGIDQDAAGDPGTDYTNIYTERNLRESIAAGGGDSDRLSMQFSEAEVAEMLLRSREVSIAGENLGGDVEGDTVGFRNSHAFIGGLSGGGALLYDTPPQSTKSNTSAPRSPTRTPVPSGKYQSPYAAPGALSAKLGDYNDSADSGDDDDDDGFEPADGAIGVKNVGETQEAYELRMRRRRRQKETVEETAGDFIQQALSMFLR